MELATYSIPKNSERFVVAPLGDFQWSGANGSTAEDHLKRHIDNMLKLDAHFFGVGDYTDFLSPSNRSRLIAAGLYDTAKDAIAEKAMELAHEVYEKFLKPTTGRWIAMLEGHHFFQQDGQTTDMVLADLLKTKFLGTSAFVRVPAADYVIYGHHGNGGGKLPGNGLNNLYHLAAGLPGADLYLMGHNTKLVNARLSRPYPVWEGKKMYMKHRDVHLVNCGGFSKSNVVGHRHGAIPRGDYAEQANMTPSPLMAPYITVHMDPDAYPKATVTA